MSTEDSMRTLALTTLALTACSSNYIPQQRGRVAVIMQTGGQAYVRDGKIIEHGLLGGGLADAVHGNPAAMEAANEYQDRIKFGLLGLFGGLACSVGGLAYAISESNPDDSSPSDASERGLWISLGCLGVMIAGTAYLASAEPYRWDAINIFNDTPPPPPLPGAPGYSISAQKQSLKMRD
jgi:hypothetical protein